MDWPIRRPAKGPVVMTRACSAAGCVPQSATSCSAGSTPNNFPYIQPVAMALHSQQVFALFSPPKFLCVGDQFNDKSTISPRLRGKQLMTSVGKKGRDSLFDPQTYRLYEGEKHGARDVRGTLEAKKKNISSQPFKPSNPPKKASGLGGIHGLLGEVPEYAPEPPQGSKSPRTPRSTAGMRNIQTSPGKRGGYGMLGTTFGPNYPYMPDPYDAPRIAESKRRKEHMAKNKGAQGFKGMTYPKTHIIDTDLTVYHVDHDKLPPVTPRKVETPPKAFIPSSPSKRGLAACLNRFPEHIPDPAAEKLQKMKEEAKEEREKISKVWVPVSNEKSAPIKPVLTNARLPM